MTNPLIGTCTIRDVVVPNYIRILGPTQSGTIASLEGSSGTIYMEDGEAQRFPIAGTKRLARDVARGFRLEVTTAQSDYDTTLTTIQVSEPEVTEFSVEAAVRWNVGGEPNQGPFLVVVGGAGGTLYSEAFWIPFILYSDMGTYYDGAGLGFSASELVIRDMPISYQVSMVLQDSTFGGFSVEVYDADTASWDLTGETISIEEAVTRGYVQFFVGAGTPYDITGKVIAL